MYCSVVEGPNVSSHPAGHFTAHSPATARTSGSLATSGSGGSTTARGPTIAENGSILVTAFLLLLSMPVLAGEGIAPLTGLAAEALAATLRTGGFTVDVHDAATNAIAVTT